MKPSRYEVNFLLRYPTFVLQATVPIILSKIPENYVPIPVTLITTAPLLFSAIPKPEPDPNN